MTTTITEGTTTATTSRRARRFARLWAGIDAAVDEQVRPAKHDVLVDLPAELVELGPGLGSNFPYYPAGTRVIAFEPNSHFHDGLHDAAREHDIELDLRPGALDGALEPESQDCVISTLVLCSVDDTDATLAEIHRVLRPGGRFVFIEHIGAPTGTAKARYQRVVRAPWRALADGCDTRADTDIRLERSGLVLESARRDSLGPRLDPTNLTYWGVARRA